jgi:hypothetical protein
MIGIPIVFVCSFPVYFVFTRDHVVDLLKWFSFCCYQYCQLTIICEQGMISIPFCNPGCIANIQLHMAMYLKRAENIKEKQEIKRETFLKEVLKVPGTGCR